MTAAQIIAYLRVVGAQQFENTLKHASKVVSSFGGQVTLGFLGPYTIGRDLLGGARNILDAFVDLGKQAVETSNDIEEITAALTALIGSAEVAADKMGFIRQLAIPSRYTAMELAQTGLIIEGMGLRLEKVLPLVAKLTMGTGRIDQASRRMAVRMFSALSVGRIPRVEQMTAFGLSRQDFEKYGIKFNKGGTMQQQYAGQGLDVLGQIITDRFGNILKVMESTGAARFSALSDLWEQMLGKMGDAIKEYLLPYIDLATRYIKFMIDTGTAQQIVSNMAQQIFGRQGEQTGFIRALALLTATLEKSPTIIKETFDGIIKASTIIAETFWTVVDLVNVVATGFKWVINQITMGVHYIFKSITQVGEMIGAAFAMVFQQGDYVKTLLDDIDRLNKEPLWKPFEEQYSGEARSKFFRWLTGQQGQKNTDWSAQISNRADELMKQFANVGEQNMGEPQDMQPWLGWGQGVDDIEDNTEETARNTKSIAMSMLDLKRYVVGGGNMAQIGATPVEIGQFRRSQGSVPVRVEVEEDLDDYFTKLVQQAVVQLMRQGVIAWQG